MYICENKFIDTYKMKTSWSVLEYKYILSIYMHFCVYVYIYKKNIYTPGVYIYINVLSSLHLRHRERLQ